MRIDILTLFPEMFAPLKESIIKRAVEDGKIEINIINIRDFASAPHFKCDDEPFGGGAGMVMRADVLGEALKANYKGGRLINMSPRGTPFTQDMAHKLACEEELTIICSRFEGIDQRVLDEYNAEDISIGDYILTGGEQAAMIMLDAVIRLLPDVLGNAESTIAESFEEVLLEHPQYTRPTNWNGREIPEVLLSGHHKKIDEWRHLQSQEITKQRRPDLWEKYLASKKV